MNQEKKQKRVKRYTDEEFELFRIAFKDNEDLLRAIRRVLYQMPLSATDLSLLSMNISGKKPVLSLLRKTFYPELDGEAPLGQQADLWLTKQFDAMISDEACLQIKAVRLMKDYLEQQLDVLSDIKKSQKIKFEELEIIDDKPNWEIYPNMIARNLLINHIENTFNWIWIYSQQGSGETVEDTVKRLSKDSAK